MRKYRSIISYLSIFILIFNISLVNAVAVNDDKILLCTSKGFIWVTLSEINPKLTQTDINSVKKDIKDTVKFHKCPFCTHNKMDSDVFIQSFYGPKLYTTSYSAQLKPTVNKLSIDALRYSSHQSRAPPHPQTFDRTVFKNN
jgi:ABC-type microcin C transport system permease subunit YejE